MDKDEQHMAKMESQVRLGFKLAYKKLIAFKKMHNSPLVVSENGKIVHIPADELTMPD